MFEFFFALNPIISITIFSVIVLFMINLCYKFLANQNEVKAIKERQKELNKKMKEEQKKGNSDEAKKIMGQVMQENSRLMRLTMKPMIVSFIVVLVFLPSLGNFYGDYNVALQNSTGNLTIGNNFYTLERSGNEVKISGVATGIGQIAKIDDKKFQINDDNGNIKLSRVSVVLPVTLPIINKSLGGWLFWYIIVSVPMMIIIRKAMKIYI